MTDPDPVHEDDASPIPLDEPMLDSGPVEINAGTKDGTGEPFPALPSDEMDIGFDIGGIPGEDLIKAAPPPVPATEIQADVLASLSELGERVDRRLDALQTLIEREARAEATREKVVDRLHAELQEYKQDMLLNTLRPVFIDLVQLHDDIGKVAVTPAGDPEAGRWIDLMRGFQQGIEDILYRQGVEPFEVEGDVFDPRKQRAVATEASDDPEKNKTVAGRLRKGFRSGDRVIRPEIVSVYTVKKS